MPKKQLHGFNRDRFRFICRRDRIRVFSRSGNDYTDRTPVIAEAPLAIQVTIGKQRCYSQVCARPQGI